MRKWEMWWGKDNKEINLEEIDGVLVKKSPSGRKSTRHSGERVTPGSLWLLTLKHVGLHGPLLQKYQQCIYNCVRISRNIIQDGFLITQSLCIISSWFCKELKVKHLHQSLKEGAWGATVDGVQRVRQDWATNTFTFWKKNGLQALCSLCFLGFWALRGRTPDTGIRGTM